MKNLRTLLQTRESLVSFLLEDVGSGDVTSKNILPRDLCVRAQILCKSESPAIVAGLEEADVLFDICNCRVRNSVTDGSRVVNGDVVMNICGSSLSIFLAERTALNVIMRMSGIATETRRLVETVRAVDTSIKIAPTRKTAPGLRSFDKRAVTLGGGILHRSRLDEMVLIKGNHLTCCKSLQQSIKAAKGKIGGSLLLECEVQNISEAVNAANTGADVIMLDNFSPEQAKIAVREIKRIGSREKIKIEISGNIGPNNILDYAEARPDVISLGYLTHSSRAVDFSLRILSRGQHHPSRVMRLRSLG
jgi:nicotinate-nucleotide pyrophosphorylase (carboxylating)